MWRSIPSFRQHLLEIDKLEWSLFNNLLPNENNKYELINICSHVQAI